MNSGNGVTIESTEYAGRMAAADELSAGNQVERRAIQPARGIFGIRKTQLAHTGCKVPDPRAARNTGLRGRATMVEYPIASLDAVSD